MPLRRLAAATLITLVALTTSASQQESSARLERLGTWLDAVEHHEPGATDGALIVTRTLSTHDMAELWRDLHGLLGMLGRRNVEALRMAIQGFAASSFAVPIPVDYSKAERESLADLAKLVNQRGGANRLVKRGALLHADIALLARARPERTWTSSSNLVPGLVLDMADGGSLGFNRVAPHLEFGRTLLDFVWPGPSTDPTIRLWYHATVAALHSEERLDLAHVSRAVELFPTDPDILLQAGCLHEWLASGSVQLSLRSVKLSQRATMQVGSVEVELTRARRLFERAARASSNRAEARIRLGRVRYLLGHFREAVLELQRGLESPTDPLLRYYAHLFLGSAHEALRNLRDAHAAYATAAQQYPRAQSARLALARLSRTRGDGDDDALRRVEEVLRLPAGNERHDPWWTYHISSGRLGHTLLAELRQQVVSSDRD